MVAGNSKALQEATDSFARALPITAELADAAEAVLAGVEAELEKARAEAALLRLADHGHDDTVAMAYREGVSTGLAWERSRWRAVVRALRQLPARPVDDTGTAYFEGRGVS
ncbi:hypothetical protein IU436_03855 [Nocardia farcinica]|uniref:hypothetical protein n=1 Tax=Nocardia farcinica TaxID=37329 RepID=UPI001893EFE3|nr:hypothetical protein [Nocardia farcinica]MBF6069784.1 hypothetical protein [Nocardia farcinica]MBF6418010.1 hypothetical protein [Nocardia farcinica]MBF6429487.1 hypothetical protein [Nocardia farcinica]MBF6500071.1 hypothetical protein [Nocardia farcinica]